jgi:hypothetical protein
VFCNSCLANGPILGDIDEAIYAWNKRANPALEHPPRFGGGSAPSGCSVSDGSEKR